MRKRDNSRGYSLVEVLIAVAITGFVLLTVVTLFYMGRRNVYSGKQMTYAVSVGTRVMEDLSTMTSGDIISAFGITDSTATGIVTVNNVDYASSLGRDTGTITTGTDPGGYLAKWNSIVDPTKLTNGKVGLIITPHNPADATAPWSTARFMRVRAYVQWDEGAQRHRIAFFDTTKVNRD